MLSPSSLLLVQRAGRCPARLKPLPGGFSAHLLHVHTPHSDSHAVLKRAATSRARILAERAALLHLSALRDIHAHIPRVLASDDAHCARAMLLSWVGEQRSTRTLEEALSAGEPADSALKALGAFLARMHQVGVPADSGVKSSDDPLSLPERLLAMATGSVQALERRSAREGSGGGLEELDLLKRACEALSQRLVEHALPERPARMVHRDLRPANILVHHHPVRFAGVVDFERAAATHPAWDFVKLEWWLFERWPHTRAQLLAGYTGVRPLPDPQHITTFALHESLTMLAYFCGRHKGYVEQARERLRRML